MALQNTPSAEAATNDLPLTALPSRPEPQLQPPPAPTPTPTPTPAPPPPNTLRLFSASLAFLVAGLNDGSLGALVPYILRTYSLRTSSIALLYASSFCGWALAALVGGHVRWHAGPGGTLLLGAACQVCAYALRVWKPPFGVYCVSFCLASLGQAFQDSSANTFVAGVPRAERWLGVIHACYGVGCMIGPLVATAMAVGMPAEWYRFFWVLFGVAIVNGGFVAWAFRGDVGRTRGVQEDDQGEMTSAWQEMKRTLKEKVVWLLSLFFFFYLGAGITAGGWIVQYLVTVRKGRLASVGYVSTGYYGGVALGRLLLVEPTSRFGERRMLLIFAALCLVLQLISWQVNNIIADAVAVSCMGFLLGPSFPTAISVGSKLLPRRIHASALGLVFVVAQAGGTVFPAVTGVIATKAGVVVLQPILIGLITAMGISWALVPRVEHKDE